MRRCWNGQGITPAGHDPVALFGTLIQSFLTFARRPLVRHGVDCACLGADEAVFALIVADASGGHLDEAIVLSGLIALPAHAEPIALLARQVGMAFRSRYDAPKADPRPVAAVTGQILH